MKRATDINEILAPLATTPNQAYLSDALQVADVMSWILEQTGAADVRLTTYSISEEFLRRLHHIRKSGKVRKLELVLDYKATHKTLLLWPFIAQTVEHCYLTDNHSKLLLAGNEKWRVTAIMSQNLTRGNRQESGLVSTDRKIYERLQEQLDTLINHKSARFNEIYGRRTGNHRADGDPIHDPDGDSDHA